MSEVNDFSSREQAEKRFNAVNRRNRGGAKKRDRSRDNRSKIITIRLSEVELADLNRKAKKHGVSRSQYMRAVLTDKELESAPDEKLSEFVQSRFFTEFSRQGNNLNQIAHRLNANDETAKDDLGYLVDGNNQLYELMLEVFSEKGVK